MRLGYARVSKSDGSQALDLQTDALIKARVKTERIFSDTASGSKAERPGLEELLAFARDGDVILVWKLDRLGRNLSHLIDLVDDLNERGVGLKVLTGNGSAIDTTRPEGKFTFRLFAALSEFERDINVERTRSGLKAARARGRKGGRPRKMDADNIRRAMRLMTDQQAKPNKVAAALGITTPTLYYYVNGDGTAKPAGQKIIDLTGT